MSNRFDLLTQQILNKNVNECTVEELQNIANQYPYFAPAQFVLLKKLKKEASPEYQTQLQKSVLYYHSPLEFDQFVNAEEYESDFDFKVSDLLGFEEQKEESFVSADEAVEEISSEPEAEEQLPSLPAFSLNTPVADSALTFEPFHTVDYFASQGIKLSQDETNTRDHFSKQLKSFTEWLKTMKRLPAAEHVKNLDPVSEKKVENIAAHSLQNSEIVTEAMAEVWIKQRKFEKAIEVYNKLSLLNPSKKAYFAAKVDNLKKAY